METAIKASISTPVFPMLLAVAVIFTPGIASSNARSTSTLVSGRGWQSGISSQVRLEAVIPATCATVSTSPFLIRPRAYQGQCLGPHVDFASCDRRAPGVGLAAHVHHASASRFVQMAQFRWHTWIITAPATGPGAPGMPDDIMQRAMPNLLSREIQYTVRTPVYEGPLDLLLDLIQSAELDITTVSLAMVTDQYLTHIHALKQTQADELSVFLVIAARLLQIKSEALLPRAPTHALGEEDLAQSLVDQLKLYKRYKDVGLWLDERQQAGLRTYLRVAPPPKIEPKLDLSNSESCHSAQSRPIGLCPGAR